MGGFDEAKKRFPNEKEMSTIIGHFKEAMDVGAAGWSAQRLVPEAGCQCNGTTMEHL
jgi:hypothetical protein